MKKMILMYVSFIVSNNIIYAQSLARKKDLNKTDKALSDLIQTDRDFCQMSLKKGMKVAFVYYADSNVIKVNTKEYPIRGILDLKSSFTEEPDGPSALSWEPLKAEVSKDGDMGYTFGGWKWPEKEPKDTTYYGYYISIWKKQKDGSWKYVFDGGGVTPGDLLDKWEKQ